MSTFLGYRRKNGSVGVRNHVLVLPSVMCANNVVDRIGRAVPEVVIVNHPTGCSQVGADFEQTKRTMAGFAANGNVAAVLVAAAPRRLRAGSRSRASSWARRPRTSASLAM